VTCIAYCWVLFWEQGIWWHFSFCGQRVVVKLISIGIFADLLAVVDIGFSNVGQNRRGMDTREYPSVSHVGVVMYISTTMLTNLCGSYLHLIQCFHYKYHVAQLMLISNIVKDYLIYSYLGPMCSCHTLLVLLKLTQRWRKIC